MSRFLAVSGAVLQKDCRELWPQAVPTAVVVAVATASMGSIMFNNLMQVAAPFVVTVLIVRLMQSDSPASVRHDWLTRPVPWMTLLAAKAAFMILWLALPQALGGMVKALNGGYALGEVLLEGLQHGAPSLVVLGVVVIAAITSSIWQAMLLLVGTIILCQTIVSLVMTRAARSDWLDITYARYTGTAWVTEWSVVLPGIVMGALILWWQYGRRNTVLARTLYAAVVVLALHVGLLMMPTSRTFAVQKQLGSDPVAAAQVAVELMPGCFASKPANGSMDSRAPRGHSGLAALLPDAMSRAAGYDAVSFSTVLVEREPAGDGHVLIAHPTARYVDAAGRTLFSIRGFPAYPQLSTTADGRTALTHHWLLARGRYQQLAARSDVRLQIDYSLSLLVPKAQVLVPTDGRRKFYSGFGYCGAQLHGSKYVSVDCFKAGPQPALLLANAVGGAPSGGKNPRAPDFTPALLSLFAGQRYRISVDVGDGQRSQAQITAYEARSHFERRITSSGILGGSKETCPAPLASSN